MHIIISMRYSRIAFRQPAALPHLALMLITPSPIFSRFNGAHYWVPSQREMLRCVLVGGVVATTYVTTMKTHAQVNPPATYSHAILTNTILRHRRKSSRHMLTGFNSHLPNLLRHYCRFFKILVNLSHHRGAFANGRADTLDGVRAYIPNCENPGHTRLQG